MSFQVPEKKSVEKGQGTQSVTLEFTAVRWIKLELYGGVQQYLVQPDRSCRPTY